MFGSFFFVSILTCVFCVENGYENKVKYLQELVDDEIEKSRNYKPRTNNEDLIGDAGKTSEIHDFGKFDFIIVGSGTSGSVVANRLTEVEKWKVLSLEAGDLNDEFTDIPYLYGASSLSDRNWGYLTTPQKNGCFGRKNNQCPYMRGKILGGSGTINQLVYARGMKADYDRWSKEGNTGWSWNEIFKYFKKMENYQDVNIDLKYRGFGGPLNVAHVKPTNVLFKPFVQANEELGIPYIEDYNAEKVSGVSLIQQNIQKGRRASGANNYVRPAWNRINYNLTLNAFVTRILIDKKTKTAYGVEFIKDGKKYQATATKEVILSGGSANSPQLLMLSGVGPKQDLEKLGIEVIKDSPVGKFMKDHIGFVELYFKSNFTEPEISKRDLVKLYLQGLGPYTAASNYREISYYNVRNKSSPQPNMEIDFSPPKPTRDVLPQFSNYKEELNLLLRNPNRSTQWNFQLYFLHPKSSGVLTLKSADAKDFPLIDSRIFDNEEDLEDMYRGIQVVMKFSETSVGKSFNLSLDLNLKSCSDKPYKSKAFWYCALRELAYPAYHLSSTAKMGRADDPLAVVNPELKVYGINNLRVVDASIVPSTITGHMNAGAFLIGEKGADMIKFSHL